MANADGMGLKTKVRGGEILGDQGDHQGPGFHLRYLIIPIDD
jgi:hypothetical protein